MIYRLLSPGEKPHVFRKLRKLGRLDHLIDADSDEAALRRIIGRLHVVGAFAGDEPDFIYWTYWADADQKSRYIAVAALRNFDRGMLRDMQYCLRHLTREWDLYGEIDPDNPAGVELGRLCGFVVAGVRDSKIIVKIEKGSYHHG